MSYIYRIFLISFLLFSTLSGMDEAKIPPSLMEWKEWVLDDVKDLECPVDHSTDGRHCSWYREIAVSLIDQKVTFDLAVTLYRDRTRVILPSVHQKWPENVTVDGKRAVLLESDGTPSLILDKGEHTISGSIAAGKDLKYLQLPPSVALVSLHKNGEKLSSFTVDKNSRLWLDRSGSVKTEKGTLSVSIYRKVIDGHPMKMQTKLHFWVSGKMRSVILDGIMLEGFLPTAVSSPLDATITEDNRLKVEIKAGEWEITVDSYTPHDLTVLRRPKGEFAYANEEVWSLQSDPGYRSIEIEGARSIDASETALPKEWKTLPAYLIDDKPFGIKELYKSAEQQQKNEFLLKRDIWLDFDGKGYTISDTIDARISEVRRLEAADIINLASVSVNNKPTLITTLGNSAQKGVELREENLRIEASGRYEGDISLPPASGWDENLDRVTTSLHLPIGWRLFASFGSDGKGSAWIDKWNLMDIFLVLLFGIALYQLFGWRWSLPSTLFMILLWHEDEAPTVIWLFVLAFAALLRVLGEGKMRRFIKITALIVLGITILKVLSFAVTEIRTALYPQLEKSYYDTSYDYSPMLGSSRSESIAYEEKMESYAKRKSPSVQNISKSENLIMQNRIDPNAVVQAGIGKPTWSWNTHYFTWQSAVGSDERLELWLIPPPLSTLWKIMNIIGVLFLLFMFLRALAASIPARLPLGSSRPLLVALLLALSPHALRADIPSDALLGQLREKLVQPPGCLPECASMDSVALGITGDRLEITLSISAGADISVPLFGDRNVWLPESVSVDGNRSILDIDTGGRLRVALTKGVHEVRMSGTLMGYDQIVLSSILPIHNLTNTATGSSWKVTSDEKSYIEINNIREQKAKEKEKSRIEPMVEVRRTLYFGLRWYIDTEVRLLNTIDKPYPFLYTLLPDESILDKEIELKDDKALLHLDNKNSYYRWRSSIPITESLELFFAKENRHTELWQMDISAIWDARYEGIEPVEQLRVGSILMPLFKPWQGQKLRLTMQKAKAVSGESLSIESSKLNIVQSGRYRDVTLDLRIKSSKAGQYIITLDETTELKPTQIDEKSHYLKADHGKVSIPLQAKAQSVKLSWREEIPSTTTYRFPRVNLDRESVNSTVSLTLPYDRWILWTNGPTLGPAVLLWGVLLAVLLFSVILGRFGGTPLRSRDWLLLGLGVSTTSVYIMLPVVVWIFALRYRKEKDAALKGGLRKLVQVGLVLLTLIAIATIIAAVSSGLLGNPDMMILGNGSYGHHLSWYSDRITAALAEPTVVTISLWYYRALMLIWAIWIAFSLIGWLKWSWEVFTTGDVWPKRVKEEEQPEPSTLSGSTGVPQE